MNKIEEITQNLKEDSLLDTIPVNLEKIANHYEIKVFYRYIGKLSGQIIKKENNTYEIIVSVLHPNTRQRFTLAHELAHYFLHKQEIGDGINETALYRSGLSNKMEAEANRLAGNIIMPGHKIDEILEEITKKIGLSVENGKEIIITLMADIFEVSKQAMTYRLGLQDK